MFVLKWDDSYVAGPPLDESYAYNYVSSIDDAKVFSSITRLLEFVETTVSNNVKSNHGVWNTYGCGGLTIVKVEEVGQPHYREVRTL